MKALWMGALLLTLAGIFILSYLARRLFVLVIVEGISMWPTLKPGDRVLALRFWPHRLLRKGQIVLVWPWSGGISSEHTYETAPYIKRITGLPGDAVPSTVSPVPKEQGAQPRASGEESQIPRTHRVPDGHIFVASEIPGGLDSTKWGPVPFRSVKGVVVWKLPSVARQRNNTDREDADRVSSVVGREAPDFSANTSHGKTLSLSSLKGRSFVLLFIHPHCPPCRRVLSVIKARAARVSATNLEFVLVDVSTAQGKQDSRRTLEVSEFPILLAPRGASPLAEIYGVTGVPYYCYIDEKGIVQSAGIAGADWEIVVDTWIENATLRRPIELG